MRLSLLASAFVALAAASPVAEVVEVVEVVEIVEDCGVLTPKVFIISMVHTHPLCILFLDALC